MKPPENFTKIVGQRRYSTRTATLIAGDDYWDCHNWERHGRNTFLYRTPRGAYFCVILSQWQGELNRLAPVNQSEAITLYETQLTEHRVTYAEAFPGVEIEDA